MERFIRAGAPYTVGPIAATSYEVTGLEPDTSTTITVAAATADGTPSAESLPLTIQTTPSKPSLAIADLSMTPSPLKVGDTALLTMTVMNPGTVMATNIAVTLRVSSRIEPARVSIVET